MGRLTVKEFMRGFNGFGGLMRRIRGSRPRVSGAGVVRALIVRGLPPVGGNSPMGYELSRSKTQLGLWARRTSKYYVDADYI